MSTSLVCENLLRILFSSKLNKKQASWPMVIIYSNILNPGTCEPYIVFTLLANELILNMMGPLSSRRPAGSKLALFKNSI